jgi:phosphoribosylamine--glycine ligase
MDEKEALSAVDLMIRDKKFGESGSRIVIEDFMTGPEVTVLAFTDGYTVVPMLSSQDHKRALTGDLGLNTGGMGAFSPSPNYTNEIADICMKTIFNPTIEAMNKESRPFKGVIYFGLMLTPKGPRVIEYNARFGDPEAQVILPMLETDLLDIFEAIVDKRLHEIEIKWRDGSCCCVVMASGGYPEKYETGFEIQGLDNVPDDIMVFHAGTSLSASKYNTKGGRVLGVTAFGGNLPEAAARAYKGVSKITFKNMYYRTDIGR